VALIPRAGRYELYDPLDETVTAVTPTVAASLGPAGDILYPSLDDSSTSAHALLRFGLRSGRHELLRLAGLSLVVAALGQLAPVATGLLFDLAIPGGHGPLVLQLGGWLAAGALVAALFQVARDLALLRISGMIQATVEPAMLDRLLDLPVAFSQRYLAGDLA